MPAGCSSSCTIDVGGQRLDLVEDRRQLLVFRGDELHGLLGDMRIAGDDGGDRLADEAHLLVRQDRLIVEGGAVIGSADHLPHVVDGDDVQHARHLLRRAGVDRLDRPCATVLRNSFATSMPGSRMVWMYSARPVTLSRPSRRGTERPICEPALALTGLQCVGHQCAPLAVQRRAHGAPDIDAHEFALVRHRAAHVRDELGLFHRRVAGALEQLVVDGLAVQHRSADFSRVAFSVAALATMRADLIASPSPSMTTATPSAGQSSTEPVVTFI